MGWREFGVEQPAVPLSTRARLTDLSQNQQANHPATSKVRPDLLTVQWLPYRLVSVFDLDGHVHDRPGGFDG